MIPNITRITENSSVDDIRDNFEAIQAAITNKQLSFHYLNLYNLKGSVAAKTSAITLEYNLLNLNEALLIVVNPDEDDTKPAEEEWRNMTLYAGDYLVKTMAGPLRIPGPITGYYKPRFNNQTELAFTYTTTEPSHDDPPITANIQGASGNGYDLTYTTWAVSTAKTFNAVSGIQPIIQIYDGNTLIDYPYTLTFSNSVTPNTYTLTITTANQGTGKTFTVRVR